MVIRKDLPAQSTLPSPGKHGDCHALRRDCSSQLSTNSHKKKKKKIDTRISWSPKTQHAIAMQTLFGTMTK